MLHRITIAGPVPIGIGGDTSIARKGDASFYSSLAACDDLATAGATLRTALQPALQRWA